MSDNIIRCNFLVLESQIPPANWLWFLENAPFRPSCSVISAPRPSIPLAYSRIWFADLGYLCRRLDHAHVMEKKQKWLTENQECCKLWCYIYTTHVRLNFRREFEQWMISRRIWKPKTTKRGTRSECKLKCGEALARPISIPSRPSSQESQLLVPISHAKYSRHNLRSILWSVSQSNSDSVSRSCQCL